MDVFSKWNTPRKPWKTAGESEASLLLWGSCGEAVCGAECGNLRFYLLNDRTAIGIKCTDGIIMGVEKTLLSKMLVAGTHRRVYAIDRHVGLVRD